MRKKKQKKEVDSEISTQLYNYRNPYPLPMKAAAFSINSINRLKAAAKKTKFNNN